MGCLVCGSPGGHCVCVTGPNSPQAIMKDAIMKDERMLKWFEFGHLPENLQVVSSKFWDAACSLCSLVDPGPERTVALRKLLEAKDAAVRAKLNPGG